MARQAPLQALASLIPYRNTNLDHLLTCLAPKPLLLENLG